MHNLPAFLSYVIITTFTPGPNNIMAMSNSSRYGFKNSLMFNAGVGFGFLIIITLCNIFSSTLYNLIPSIKPIMTFIGAAYILYLSWKTYISKNINIDKSNKNTNSFLNAVLLQFVNPKGILYGITTASTFIIPYYKSSLIIAFISIALSIICFISTCCWSLFGSMFQKFFIKNGRIINTIMSLLLLYCAVSLFL